MIWHLLSRQLAPLTLAGAIAAYLHPPLFLFLKDYFLWLFAATMFALGVVLQPEEARDAMKHPARIGLGVLTQFSVMPLLGFAAASLAVSQGVSPMLALGFIIVGCAPGAMASNVITYLAGGAVAFSIAMTMLATVLSPLLTPLLVEILGKAYMDIPFWPMMQTILLTVALPLGLGIVLRRHLGDFKASAEQMAPGIAALAIILICSYAVAANQGRIADTPMLVVGLVILLNALGYLLGWLAGHLFRFDLSHRITLSIEIGMQNAGLGVALALKHFQPETALPGALFAVWCIITAAGMTRLLNSRRAVA
ncbi:MAG: bile acid:sodium symporter [Zetaproteobacteria bacterium CG06_land_8_20_14_3_00_59_53]|nr:MAG: bile acid:sodium symporter [Zetaproteobacteria bacterium CG2_30_59_37]PIO90104.1 MAG: bile acid:sodium symporter [Zetaproteobacteria bacterium CG23_combo_of_CG06-09_8_20_14_all_59_86]PIQ64825.1 MAG: bile acid:sodium symporter [Zetaproteobacteria bacterium CG11_big_fil_rev_8_21_14_0_20_59_439]PIU69504.1 MAG: bile acid:sodium symporter [Zetaproteobacteria bacterium CG06_land_8_20_14_3_00_59_53]PIU96743.1 MAG: bile acid:sodium symporter [Zetaproteobacteria bacterium CG03_land_8_20_14_0_80_